MPTCYTSILAEREDMTLRDFALMCARNFGALVMMRDEPLDAPIPEKFEPEAYIKKNLDEAQKEYDDFLALTEDEQRAYLERTYTEMVEGYEKEIKEESAKKEVLRKRYNAMLLKVVKWTPPTPEHEGLRDFMIKQLHDSIEWDCSEYQPIIPSKEGWCDIEGHIGRLKQNLQLSKECYEKHLATIASRNKWLTDLRESLTE